MAAPIAAAAAASAAPKVIGGIASLAGGLFGGKSEEAKRLERDRLLREQELYDYISRLTVPTVQERTLDLEDYNVVGELTPELEQAIAQGDTELANIIRDQEAYDAQMSALRSLAEIADAGGMDATFKRDVAEVGTETDANIRKANEALKSEMARRGAAGSGLEQASRLAAAQQQATAGAARAMDAQAIAQQRALQAISDRGRLGADARQQSFQEQEAAARAQDLINQFNVQGSRGTQQRNVAAQRAADEFNLRALQGAADANVGQRTLEEQSRAGAVRDQFTDRLFQTDRMTRQAGALGGQESAQAAQARREKAAQGGAIADAGAAFGGILTDVTKAYNEDDDEDDPLKEKYNPGYDTSHIKGQG